MSIKNGYTHFDSFRLNTAKFLALKNTSGDTEIYNESMQFYGSYWSKESFVTMYRKHGEELKIIDN